MLLEKLAKQQKVGCRHQVLKGYVAVQSLCEPCLPTCPTMISTHMNGWVCMEPTGSGIPAPNQPHASPIILPKPRRRRALCQQQPPPWAVSWRP